MPQRRDDAVAIMICLAVGLVLGAICNRIVGRIEEVKYLKSNGLWHEEVTR
jgi:hypothetical protein